MSLGPSAIRVAPDLELDAAFLSVGLTDPADCEAKLSGLSEVTHVFYAAARPCRDEQGRK